MRKKLLFISIFAAALCSGCSGDDLGTDVPEVNDFAFSGYIQKGQFITGTSVEVRELDDALNSTGKTFSTQITNDFGSFDISCKSDQSYAEFIADGYYFDEVEGELSEGELKLRAIAKMNQSTNINVLTTLQADRMRSLIKDGKGYDEALTQSKREVLKIFNINEDEVANFSSMNITEQGVSNSILLAISSILQCDRSVAEMSELISKLSLDIADNGVVDNASLANKIVESSKEVDSADVIRNLEERYKELGEEVTIDNFYDFIDSDGDGVLNGDKPYLFVDDSNYSFDYVASKQYIYFNSNYTPELNIVSDDNFVKVVSIEGAKVVVDLLENELKTKRTAELQFLSEDGAVVESVFIEQASSYAEVAFEFRFGPGSRAALPDSDTEVKRVTVIAFDADGNLLFNDNNTAPELDYGRYTRCLKFSENYYENCTLYTIVNGVGDYSSVSTISDAEQLKGSIEDGEVLSAKNENVSFSNGRPTEENGESVLVYCPTPEVSLQYAGFAKMTFFIEFDESIAESDREISSLILNGDLYTNAYLFSESKENLDKATSIPINAESLYFYSTLVGSGSTVQELVLTSTKGNTFAMVWPMGFELKQGMSYSDKVPVKAYIFYRKQQNDIEDSNTSSNSTEIGFSTSTDNVTK